MNSVPFKGKDESISYKIDRPGLILEIGESIYYDKCIGLIGNKRCEGYVNIKYGRICGLHSRPKIKHVRPELNNTDFAPTKRDNKVGPPKKHNLPRHVYEPKPAEFTQLDRYLSVRNKQCKEYQKNVEIEVREGDSSIPDLKRKFEDIEKQESKRVKPND